MKNDNIRLQNTINFLCEKRKIHISIHDVLGILSKNDALKLPWSYQINDCPFCNSAKTTPAGHKICMKFKTLSVKKCKNEGKLYIGKCYLGITQIVCPVIWQNSLVCIIYVGNIVEKNDIDKNKFKFDMYEKRTKIESHLLKSTLQSCEIVDDASKYTEAALIVKDVIISTLDREKKKISEYNTAHHIISSIMNHCKQYYYTNISLSELSRIYFLHPDYLCKLFKKETGVSFSNYINYLRIEAAKSLLESTDKRIIDIAYEVGYTSDTYFIKKFKQIMGISPKLYYQTYVKHRKP